MNNASHTEIYGRALSDQILSGVANDVAELKSNGWPPKLVSIKVGENPSVDLYIRNQRRKAENAGIAFEERFFPEGTSIDELHAAIFTMNVDPRVSSGFGENRGRSYKGRRNNVAPCDRIRAGT